MPSRLIDCLATTEALETLFGDESVLRAMVGFEVALARAEAQCGIIPLQAADAISAAGSATTFDAAAIARDSRSQATVAIPFVKAFTESVRSVHPESAGFVHWGATSQDVTDTALVLLLLRARGILAADHVRLLGAIRRLSDEHADTVMLGRTLLQAAPPVTFGLKAAGWFAAVQRNWTRLDAAFQDAGILQFGGACGTLAALGERGLEGARLLGEALGLAVPVAPWHAHRDRLAAVVTNCGIYTGTLGKIARDGALLMQGEVGEVSAPGGTSSAMPHKRNPASFSIALACAHRVPGLVAGFLSGMVQEHERAAGGLQAEWPAVVGVVQSTGAALASVADAMEDLTIHPDRMRQNIRATGGLVFSERLMMLIAGTTGRVRAYTLVAEASRMAREDGISLVEALRRIPEFAGLLTREQITGLDVPEDYLGSAELFRQRLLNS
jgi:3-carboxy-cis,cis-muconate cycloisomerase